MKLPVTIMIIGQASAVQMFSDPNTAGGSFIVSRKDLRRDAIYMKIAPKPDPTPAPVQRREAVYRKGEHNQLAEPELQFENQESRSQVIASTDPMVNLSIAKQSTNNMPSGLPTALSQPTAPKSVVVSKDDEIKRCGNIKDADFVKCREAKCVLGMKKDKCVPRLVVPPRRIPSKQDATKDSIPAIQRVADATKDPTPAIQRVAVPNGVPDLAQQIAMQSKNLKPVPEKDPQESKTKTVKEKNPVAVPNGVPGSDQLKQQLKKLKPTPKKNDQGSKKATVTPVKPVESDAGSKKATVTQVKPGFLNLTKDMRLGIQNRNHGKLRRQDYFDDELSSSSSD